VTSNLNCTDAIPRRFKFATVMMWLFILVSLYIFIYTFWRSEVVLVGSLREGYFYFYLFSFSGILFWGMALRLKNEIKLNLVIASISLTAGLYIAELYLSLNTPVFSSLRVAAEESGAFYDTRSKFEVARDLRAEGIDAQAMVVLGKASQTNPEYDSVRNQEYDKSMYILGGNSGKTTVVYNESGKFMVTKYDRYGFNNPDSAWDTEKPDWVLLGDSFTFGFAVQPGEEMSSQIRNLTHSSVINLGYPGNGPLSMLAGLKEYAEAKVPKRVLWIYWEGNDMLDLKEEKKISLLMSYLQPEFSQNLIHRQGEIDSFLNKKSLEADANDLARSKTLKDIKQSKTKPFHNFVTEAKYRNNVPGLKGKQSYILRLFHLRNLFGVHPRDFAIKPKVIDPLFADILTIARDRVAAQGGKFYFVYLPSAHRYIQFLANHDNYAMRKELLKVVESLNIPVIDIHEEIFKNHKPTPLNLFPFGMRAHYNAEGYRLVARAILKEVEKK
jgi:hypothetical protein